MRGLRLRIAGAVLLSAGAAFDAPAAAQAIQRCEDGAGKVTYVNGICPNDARRVRDVANEPTPSATDQKLANERARNEAATLRQIEKQNTAERAAASREAQVAQAKADKLAATCRKLDLKLRGARDKLASATLQQRAERERQMRHAEEDYVRDCGPLPR